MGDDVCHAQCPKGEVVSSLFEQVMIASLFLRYAQDKARNDISSTVPGPGLFE